MRSRAVRLTASALTLVALGAIAFFLVSTEQRIAERRTGLRRFDLRAREAVGQLGDARSAQQAYVATGQSASFWTPKVSALIEQSRKAVDELRGLATTGDVRQLLLDVSSSLTELVNVDKRTREYLNASQDLMAADVVFSEGAPIAAQAAQEVEATRQVEHDAFEIWEAAQRRAEVYALAGGAALTTLVLLLLAVAPARAPAAEPAPDLAAIAGRTVAEIDRAEVAAREARTDASLGALATAAGLSTALGRVANLADLQGVIGRAADAMDASGLVVWLESAGGAELRPVLTHGYAEPAVRLLRNVPRDAANAAAAAFRSGSLQVVQARPGEFGAIVAPLLSASGCIGALSAEIRHGAETAAAVQAIAAIVAAHLAVVFAEGPAEASPARTATA